MEAWIGKNSGKEIKPWKKDLIKTKKQNPKHENKEKGMLDKIIKI